MNKFSFICNLSNQEIQSLSNSFLIKQDSKRATAAHDCNQWDYRWQRASWIMFLERNIFSMCLKLFLLLYSNDYKTGHMYSIYTWKLVKQKNSINEKFHSPTIT